MWHKLFAFLFWNFLSSGPEIACKIYAINELKFCKIAASSTHFADLNGIDQKRNHRKCRRLIQSIIRSSKMCAMEQLNSLLQWLSHLQWVAWRNPRRKQPSQTNNASWNNAVRMFFVTSNLSVFFHFFISIHGVHWTYSHLHFISFISFETTPSFLPWKEKRWNNRDKFETDIVFSCKTKSK